MIEHDFNSYQVLLEGDMKFPVLKKHCLIVNELIRY